MSTPPLPVPPDAAPPGPHAGGVPLAHRLQGMNLYLVGMMGAGKSSVGRPLAERLGYRFVDADSVLEQAAGRSIPQVFAEDGEAGFRELETSVLGGIAGWHSLVVATGGGVVTRPQNWGLMRQGLVIWLDAPPERLLARLRADPTPRPLLQSGSPEQRLSELLEQRRPLYAQADLHVLQAEGDAAAVADQVLAALPEVLRQPDRPPAGPAELVDDEGQPQASFN